MFRLVPIALLAAALHGETITGTIRIERKLTRRSVSAPVAIYQRGSVTAGPSADADADPLDFERAHVVIWIDGEGPAGRGGAVLKQAGRRFAPDLVAIAAGSSVSFPNMDPVFHNVFSLSPIKTFDLGNYAEGEDRRITFPKPGIVFVNCHLHPNMSAAIVVAPNGWFSQAGADGAFSIADVPPGRYTVTAWHKAAGLFHKTIEVAPGSGAAISFFIPLAKGPE